MHTLIVQRSCMFFLKKEMQCLCPSTWFNNFWKNVCINIYFNYMNMDGRMQEQNGVHTLLEKRSFVPVHNPHLYRVLKRYKPSSTNGVEHLYRARYLLQMPHICTGWSLGPVQMSLPPSDVVGGICTGWRYHPVQICVFLVFFYVSSL
jgi:hypothetical protein